MEHGKAVDSIQQRITEYAHGLTYDSLSPQAIHAAKVRVIDTLGALIAGFWGDPCRIARNVAAQMPAAEGATVFGTRWKTTPDMAAFVNGTTARYPELTDIYTWPGSAHGHGSDALMAVMAAAEHAGVDGHELITGVVLAYEIYLRFSDIFHNRKGFDTTNFACIGSAVGAGKMLGLTSDQLSHCIAMAVVPNVILRQVKAGKKSMFKAVATGQAGRAGVFAALLARAGMEGPHLPFEGKAGWCEHVAQERFALDTLGGGDIPFKILDTHIKLRPANASALGCILAAEKVAPVNIREVKSVTVEVYKYAKDSVGSDPQLWNPDSREAADHSIPYVVAAALMDGTVTLRSFNEAHLRNPELRALMQKIEVVENPEFTKAYERLPVEENMRVTVLTNSGTRLVGETTVGDKDDLAAPKSDAQIEQKFRTLTEDVLGAKQVDVILARLWRLEEFKDVAEIPPAFVLD